MRRRIDDVERRARLVVRHRLAPRTQADAVADVARDLVVLHATDPASVFLAAAARMREPEVAAIERALYEERTLVRILGMRRTMFVVPVELVPVVHASSTRAIAVKQRLLLLQHLEQSGVDRDVRRWLERVEEATLRAIAARGEVTGAELAADVPDLRRQITLNADKSYGGASNATSRVLFLLAADERIVRCRPKGSWTSSQFRWAPMASWLPGMDLDVAAGTARTELVRRWLRAFGPGTVADLRWWTGWTAREVTRALDDVDTVEVDLEAGTGLVLAEDAEPVAAPEPSVALLPALDPTVMGWTGRRWFLGEHGPALFDRSGNPGPTVWWNGRIVGGWAQRRDGQVAYRLLEDVGADARRAAEAAAARLTDWIGPIRVTPRFRTPLERELSA